MTSPSTARASMREYAKPVLAGVLVAAVGLAPWVLLVRWNARWRPELPWAAVGTAVFLTIFLAWLDGAGWPRRTSAWRRRSLRLRPSGRASDDTTPRGYGGIAADQSIVRSAAPFAALLGLLTVLWVLVGRTSPPPDLSAYPTTAYRFSVVIMTAVVAGVVEEAAFRGYMQGGLERFGAERAVLITSVVFTLSHGVHGLEKLLLVGPGFFVASLLYGMLALRTGTILPGMIIHTLGDLAYTYLGLLRGDWRLLFA